jgi:glycosyltransferase involved in cell wall biosynthesis
MAKHARRDLAPEMSVVIPVHNGAATLPACLDALCAQTLPSERYEVLVVDNNSTDGSANLARRAPGVRVLEEQRQGAYAARNRGLAGAHGEVLVFTDPDCVADPDWLEAAQLAVAEGALVVLGESVPAGQGRLIDLVATYERGHQQYVFGGADPTLYYGRTNNMAVHRSVFEDVGPFIEQGRGADTLFVRATVGHFGADRVRFEPRMRVRHVEVERVRSHLQKLHVYGYVHHGYQEAAPIRPLRLRERAELLRRAADRAGGAAALPLLAALVLAADLSWRLGRLRASLRLPPPRGTSPARPPRASGR